MARLPSGWHWVSGRDKRQGARDPSGRVHTRQQAENAGARAAGFRSAYDERQSRRTYARYEGANPRQRERDLADARAAAARRGETWTRQDEARFNATRAGMQVGGGDRQRALADFLVQTGRVDTPEQALASV